MKLHNPFSSRAPRGLGEMCFMLIVLLVVILTAAIGGLKGFFFLILGVVVVFLAVCFWFVAKYIFTGSI